MAYQLSCAVLPTQAHAGPSVVANVLRCDSGWIVTEVVPSDFAQLVELLSFDLGVFSTLLGTCIVIFIMGHSAGKVARTLGRA